MTACLQCTYQKVSYITCTESIDTYAILYKNIHM